MTGLNHLPVAETECGRAFILFFRNGLDAAAQDLRHIGGIEKAEGGQGADQHIHLDAGRDEKWKQDDREKQNPDNRQAANDVDIEMARRDSTRTLGSSGKRERQSERQADDAMVRLQ